MHAYRKKPNKQRPHSKHLISLREQEVIQNEDKIEYSKETQFKLEQFKHLCAKAQQFGKSGNNQKLNETYEKLATLSKDLAINYGTFFAPDHNNLLTFIPHNNASMVEFKRKMRTFFKAKQNEVHMWDLIRTYFVHFQAELAHNTVAQVTAIERLEALQRNPAIAKPARVDPGPHGDHLLKLFDIAYGAIKALYDSPMTAQEIEADQLCLEQIDKIMPILKPEPKPALEMSMHVQEIREKLLALEKTNELLATRTAELQAKAASQPTDEDILKELKKKMKALSLLKQSNDEKAKGLQAELEHQRAYTPAADDASEERKSELFATRYVLLTSNKEAYHVALN